MSESRYELYGHDGRRWLIDSVHPTLTKSLIRCDQLSDDANSAFTLLRVVDAGGDGTRRQVVHEQSVRRGKRAKVRMQPVEEAWHCVRQVDYYAVQARLLVGRLLRRFLDDERLTALELMHDYGHLRRLMRDDRLYAQAINHVAVLQARQAEMPTAERRAELERAIQAVVERSRKSFQYDALAQTLAEHGAAAAWAALPAERTEEQKRALMGAVVARHLRGCGDWCAKLSALLALAPGRAAPEVQRVIDEAAGEVLQSPEAVSEILGHGSDLTARLVARVRLVRARLDEADLAAVARDPAVRDPELAGRLAAAFAAGGWEAAPGVLLRQVEAVFNGTRPLADGPGGEAEAFEAVLAELRSLGGPVGGPTMADALTRRARLVYGDAWENLGPKPGAETMIGLLPRRSEQIGYLLALAASPYGRKYETVMVELLTQTLQGLRDRRALAADGSRAADADGIDLDAMTRELADRLELFATEG
jgi:hypothetical protein